MVTPAQEYLAAYSEYSKTIRTWFVAFGIGAPVLLLTNKELAAKLTTSNCSRAIAVAFLFGACLQVVLAAANKFSMWGLYYGEITPAFKDKKRYRVGFWFSEAMWIDFVVDMVTLCTFGLGTWWAFGAVMN